MSHNDQDLRGSASDRRARRAWILDRFGNGVTVKCCHCSKQLSATEFEVDRFPLCGHDGGRYTRNNIVPSCRWCNVNRCKKCKGAIKKRGGLLSRQKNLPYGQSPWPAD